MWFQIKILKQNDPKLTYTSITKSIIKSGPIGGPKTLYNGLSACFFREVPGYAIYFTTYNFLNDITNNIKYHENNDIGFTKTLFVLYISKFGNFDMVYGTISAVIILLLFSYISSIIVVFFAEVSNVFSTMRDTGRFRVSKEIIITKGGLKPFKNAK